MTGRGVAGRTIIALTLSAAVLGCARQATYRGPHSGVASWYGPGFNGRPTASGEIYDQEDLTAASPGLPLGSRVMVSNLDNGRSLEVRINDRGPFVKGRVIDLSHRAAELLGILDAGTAHVKVEPLSTAAVRVAEGYAVQVGAFADAGNAERLREQLAASYEDVRIERLEAGQQRYYRVRMGNFASRDEAESRAVESARLGLPVVIISQ